MRIDQTEMRPKKSPYTIFRCALIALTLFVGAPAFAFPIRMALAPDNNQALLASVIHSAKRELIINVYQFESPEIAQMVIAKIQSGVAVRLLVEGEPLGQISPKGQDVLAAISGAIRASGNPNSALYLMVRPDEMVRRRFRYNHAKYVISDRRYVLISSENFTATGHPRPGQLGNRGWDIAMDNAQLADQLLRVYFADSDGRYSDVVELRTKARALPPAESKGTRPTRGIAQGDGEASQGRIVESPHSLDEIIALIRSARKHISVEKMSLPKDWRSPTRHENPIVSELIRAAQRGVNVRVLLNDEAAFGRSDSDGDELKGNAATVQLLKTVATSEGLPLTARLVNYRAAGITYIHNKGILVDGVQAFVSSINGTQNSVENNREIAVLLQSPDAARYYGFAFDFDWNASAPRKRASDLRPMKTIPAQFFDLSRILESISN